MASNGYYNNPMFAQAANNIASMFAPPSAQDQLYAAKAAETKQKMQALGEYFRYSTDPNNVRDPHYRTKIDAVGIGLGNFAPNQSFYSVDQGNATTLSGKRIDADSALAVARQQGQNDLTKMFASPITVGKDQTVYLPQAAQKGTGLQPALRGNIGVGVGERTYMPDAQGQIGPNPPMLQGQTDVSKDPTAQYEQFLAVGKTAGMSDDAAREFALNNVGKGRGGAAGEITVGPDGSISIKPNQGKLTEVQGKYALFATRADQANQTMDEVLNNGYAALLSSTSAGSALDYVAGMNKTESPAMQLVYNQMKTPEGQKYYQAANSFMTSILRPDTGAAVTPGEFQLYGAIFIPMPGDGPEVIANKTAARKTATAALQALSNGGADTIAAQLVSAGLPVPLELQKYVKGVPPAQDVPTTPAPPTSAAPAVQPPREAVQMLMGNPQLAPQFDAKYGPGAAKKFLGGAGG